MRELLNAAWDWLNVPSTASTRCDVGKGLMRPLQLQIALGFLIALSCLTVGAAQTPGQTAETMPSQSAAASAALEGAIDVHVHSYPDDRPRSIDAVAAARLARERGMRGIVLKNHYDSTAGIAYLVRSVVPDVEVFGGITLNLSMGGINPSAVDYMARMSGGWGRVVWMPTRDAENQVLFSKENRPFVRVSRGGVLLNEVASVLSLIAKHHLVLATGHVSASEALLLLREGRRAGIRNMLVTHAMNAPVSMTVPQMREAAKLGAFLEFVGGSIAGAEGQARLARFADAIRQVGPESCILSSDLGQEGNPLPPDGFGEFLVAMSERGFTGEEITAMSKTNPARLFNLP